MEYLLNGDIYIKKGPVCLNDNKKSDRIIDFIIDKINVQTGFEIKVPDEIERGSIEELNFIISEIQDLNDYSKSLITKNTYSFILDFVNYVLSGGNPNIYSDNSFYDYSGCQNFWQLFVINSKIVMEEKGDEKLYKLYKYKNELDRDYIRLYDFLDSAKFIGMEFKRTKPLKSINGENDKSFMNSNYLKYIVLYENNGLFLVLEKCDFMEKYFILESKYIMDNNYTFYGKVYEEYNDKSKVFRDIIEQIIPNRRKDNKIL